MSGPYRLPDTKCKSTKTLGLKGQASKGAILESEQRNFKKRSQTTILQENGAVSHHANSQISGLERSPSQVSSSEENDSSESPTEKAQTIIKSVRFKNRRANLIQRIYTKSSNEMRMSLLEFLPDLDIRTVLAMPQQPGWPGILEHYFITIFSELLQNVLAKGNLQGQKYIDQNFEAIYDQQCERGLEVQQIVAELQAICKTEASRLRGLAPSVIDPFPLHLSSGGLSPSPDCKQEMIEDQFSSPLHRKGENSDLDSPPSKFLPHGEIVNRGHFKVG